MIGKMHFKSRCIIHEAKLNSETDSIRYCDYVTTTESDIDVKRANIGDQKIRVYWNPSRYLL